MTARTLDTMSDAIALSSPSGRMSRRAMRTAQERLRRDLFGDGLPMPNCEQETHRQYLTRWIGEYTAYAERGFRPRARRKAAARLQSELDALIVEGRADDQR